MSDTEKTEVPTEVDVEAVAASDADVGVDSSAAPDATPAGSAWSRVVAYGLLPVVIVLLTAAAGLLAYRDHSASAADAARAESLGAAADGTVALLSYQADTADKTLNAARDQLTGNFRDSYTKLIHDVVIPGAKQKHISSVATVPAKASVSVSARHAVALLFVNQNITVGSDAPTASTSCVRVTLDKVGNRWLISQFDPI